MKRLLFAPALILCGSLGLAQTFGDPVKIPGGRPVRPPEVIEPATDRIVNGLTAPLYVTHAPGDTTRIFILQQNGIIRIVDLGTDTLVAMPFLDIDALVINTGNERGLLGMAFHPDYGSNGLFYVNYSRAGDGANVISEFAVSGDPNVGDAGSERILLVVPALQENHNGGWIDFSPADGYLYIATGDGGLFCDTGTGHTAGIGNSQDITSNLLGKLLRIDPLAAVPYGVPGDNPFVGIDGDDEIWCYGLRNPWRCSFDSATGDLYIGDVGQNAREEVDFQSAGSVGGENYGWRCREGNACSTASPSLCGATTGCTCPGVMPSLTAPVHDYDHSTGACSIIGGYVYRGAAIPPLVGAYLFADHCRPRLTSLRVVGGVATQVTNITALLSPSIDGFTVGSITSFGEDANGEMYIVDRGGEIFRIVPAP